MCKLRFLLLSLLLPFSLLLALSPDETAKSVAAQINSPFCKGRLLRDCPSSGATDLKIEISELAEKGMSEREIIDSLYTKYGDEIRAVPNSDLMGKVGWLAPVLFLGIGGVLLGVWIGRNKSAEKM